VDDNCRNVGIYPQRASYFSIWYLIISFYGFIEMRRYVNECVQKEVLPFKGSACKMLCVSLISGLFTSLAIVIGIIFAILDIFRKKD
jgi:hypothetical protein